MSHTIADLGMPNPTAAPGVLCLILIRSQAKIVYLRTGPSAADLKFLHQLWQARLGTSNRKAALES
jgi:hypothetical protein